MSTRNLAAMAVAAICGAAALGIAVHEALTANDLGHLFTLALVVSVGLILSVATHRWIQAWGETIGAKLDAQRITHEMPVPTQLAHQIGFKQGWEAAKLANPSELIDFVEIFEKRFPAPPN